MVLHICVLSMGMWPKTGMMGLLVFSSAASRQPLLLNNALIILGKKRTTQYGRVRELDGHGISRGGCTTRTLRLHTSPS